jgi:protein-disulfide isomerase
LTITKRAFANGTTLAMLSTALFNLAGRRGLSPLGSARAQTTNSLDLTDPGPLPDHVLGSSTATVTIIEYVSMTCPHCAMFAIDTFPELKTRFIDTGKVQYIIREYPLDALAVAASMLVRSVGNDKYKYYDAIEKLFRQQRQWASGRVQNLMTFAVTQLGFTEAGFNTCLADQQLLDRVIKARERASAFGVSSAPAFFINGDKHSGFITIKQMEDLIAPHLKP